MNSLRVLGIAGMGDREAPTGLNLRQEELGGEDRFKSILSRIAGSVRGEVASPDAEERVASGRTSGASGDRVRKQEAPEEVPDDDLATGPVNALPVAERQVRMFPDRVEANLEYQPAAPEPGTNRRVPTVTAPTDDNVVTAVTALVDLPASVEPTLTEIGLPDSFSQPPDPADREVAVALEPAEPRGAGDGPPPLAALEGYRPAYLETTATAAAAGEQPARRTELTGPQRGPAPAETEPGRLMPRVTVISRERYLAPAEHPHLARLAPPPSNPQPEALVAPLEKEVARPDALPRSDRLAKARELPPAPAEPRFRPQIDESGLPRNPPAAIAPAVTAALFPTTDLPAAPDDGAGGENDLAQRVATLPELARAAVVPEQKPHASARRFEPAGPAPSDPRPELPGSPVAASPPVGPEATVRSVRQAPETPSLSPIVPGSLHVPERNEHGRETAGLAPAAASAAMPATEGTLTPTSAAPTFGQEVLQKISGALVEAAGSAALSAAAPVATAGSSDHLLSAPARALTIRVDLHEHGAVHVRLALKGNALSLRMRADREEIAEQLRQDHAKLSETLSAAGYDTEIVAIEGRRNEIAPASGNDAAGPVGTGADGAANADRGAGGENRRPTARPSETPNQGSGEDLLPHDQDDHEPRNIAQRSADALYV